MIARDVRTTILWAGAVLAAVCGGALVWWSVRSNTTDRIELPGGGTASVKHRWGMIVEIRIDDNGDGKADLANEFEPGVDGMTNHQQPSRRWMDLDYDGRLEVDMHFRPGRGVVEVRLDTDQDGTFDETLPGEAAAAFERELRHSSRRR